MIIKKLGTVIATAALFGSVLAPAAFADTITVAHNGAGSDNDVSLSNKNSLKVYQSNVTVVGTHIYQYANTGHNEANGNTGGDVSINTGDASNKAHVEVAGGNNSVILPEQCGCRHDTEIKVKDNGANSENDVKVKNHHSTTVEQSSSTSVHTKIKQKSNTGYNDANWNTNGDSSGDPSIDTGKASNEAWVAVGSGDNTVQ